MARMTKAAKRDQEARDQLDKFYEFRDAYNGKEFDGKIRWFDAMSGEGMAEIDGYSFYIHFSAIDGVDKNNYQWPTEADRARLDKLGYNKPCKLTPYISHGYIGIEKCIVDLGE